MSTPCAHLNYRPRHAGAAEDIVTTADVEKVLTDPDGPCPSCVRIIVDLLRGEVKTLRDKLADIHHDLRLCVGDDYTTPASAAVEACRRLQVAEAEIRRLRALDDSDG